MKKNLEQLKKDYDQIGKTITELENPTILCWPSNWTNTEWTGWSLRDLWNKYKILRKDTNAKWVVDDIGMNNIVSEIINTPPKSKAEGER